MIKLLPEKSDLSIDQWSLVPMDDMDCYIHYDKWTGVYREYWRESSTDGKG